VIWPRWIAQIIAWFTWDWWIPCPVCGEYYAGFERGPTDRTVNHRIEGGDLVSEYTCCRTLCQLEGARQTEAYEAHQRAMRNANVLTFRPRAA
jgi:hypothetical protein